MSGVFNPPPFRPGDIAGECVMPLRYKDLHVPVPPRPAGVRFDYFIDPEWLEYESSSVRRDLATGYARAWAREQEAIVREMLGRWVSELEPCLVIRDTHVVGLGMAGDPEGKIIIRPVPVEQRATFRHMWPDGRPML